MGRGRRPKNSKLSKLGPNPNFDPVKFYGRKHLCQTKKGDPYQTSRLAGEEGGKNESAKGEKCKAKKHTKHAETRATTR